ncbi:hypothetical protein M407DRAFT_5637 [Tulasnella calospora MUT 4182]|uniref:Uncharacterized protein n=1 Tax=Tulasnella calospora MUT 4182 TaxID=1051891 RepID=A0A0C3QRK6_9AGAM|nr:hypothetical protein M407DRAFT_5637 [Tulasnella calospora MUT 4182]
MVAVLQGASPGSTKLLSGLAPKVDICSRLTLVILQNLVPKCWSIDPKKRQSSSSVLQCLKYVELGNSDPPPSPDQPPHDEEKADIWATSQPTTAKLSILSKHELEERGYYRMQLISRAEGWVSEDAPEPEVVLRCHEDGFHLSVAPNGKWLAVNFQATSQLWNLEHLSSPPLDLPARGLWARYEWSPDSQHLACFDGNDLYTWSTESQSNKGHFNGRPVWSAAWFSNGEALAVESVGQISIMSTKSGQFQMGSDWMLATSRAHQASPMATIPVDCVGGRRIVVMTGCQQISDDVNGVRDRFWVPGWASNKREATIKALARAPHDDGVQNVTISRNGEFVLLSHHNASPALWRLKVTDGDGIWNIQITLTYSFSMPPNFLPSTHVYWVSFGGDNDEWVISATTQGHIIIWDTQSPEPFRAIEGLPYPEYSSHPKVVYCPTKDKSSSLMLLYGQDRREVVVWKWWKVSSDWIMVI